MILMYQPAERIAHHLLMMFFMRQCDYPVINVIPQEYLNISILKYYINAKDGLVLPWDSHLLLKC